MASHFLLFSHAMVLVVVPVVYYPVVGGLFALRILKLEGELGLKILCQYS